MKTGLTLLILFLLSCQNSTFAQLRPTPAAEDTRLFQDGEALFTKGETEKALWRFRRLTNEYPKSPLLNEAKFRMGVCYTQLKRPKEAIRVLTELLSTFLVPVRMVQVFTLLGDNHLQSGDPFNSLHWYGKGLLIQGQPKEELRGKVRSLLDAFETEESLTRAESLYRGAYAGGYAKLLLARMARRRGDLSLTRRILSEIEREYPGMDYSDQIKEILGSIRAPVKSKYTLGVILPLSGIHQPFGTRVLHAIQWAVREESSFTGKQPLLSLSVRDSKGNAKEAEKVVEDLFFRDKAVAVLGPLLSVTADSAARKAQAMKIPLLTFSQKEPLAGGGEFVFQTALTPSAQIQALVTYAVRDLEARTFAVFYPNSPYGALYKNLFNQEVSRRGGKILGSVAYQEEQTDFSMEIKGFFRMKPIGEPEGRKKKTEAYQSGLNVDAIFVPDTYDRAGLLLAQMVYFDVPVHAFLGTNAWNHPRLIPLAGIAAEKTCFVDCFFKGHEPSPVQSFTAEFKKTHQREPETLEAIGYDGARFLKEILQAETISSPLQLRNEIARMENFQGVSGLKGFGEKGNAIRELLILGVRENRIVQIQP